MSEALLQVDAVSKHFGGLSALAEFSCVVRKEEVVGLLGPNGAGKTTLFNVLTGFVRPDMGRAIFRGVDLLSDEPYRIANLGIRRTFQDLRLIRRISVLENVLLAFRGQPGEQLTNIFMRWRVSKRREAENRDIALELLNSAGLGGKTKTAAGDLSYGQQKLLSLVCCLAGDADLLLLDEPVAGVAPEMIERILAIIGRLPEQGKSVVLIEHNLGAVTRVCDRVIFMDAGANLCEGTLDEVRSNPQVIEAYLD